MLFSEIVNVLPSLEFVIQYCALAKNDAGGIKRLVDYIVVEGKVNKIHF